MTSIRVPFVSPFPVECIQCDMELDKTNSKDKEVKRRRYRRFLLVCPDCGTEFWIRQPPLLDEYEYEDNIE